MSQLTPHWESTGYQVEALAWAWAVRPNTGHVKVSDLGTLTGTLAVGSVQGRKEKAELLGLCNRWEQVFLGAGRGGQGTGAGVRAFRAAILDRMARDLTWDETMVKAEEAGVSGTWLELARSAGGLYSHQGVLLTLTSSLASAPPKGPGAMDKGKMVLSRGQICGSVSSRVIIYSPDTPTPQRGPGIGWGGGRHSPHRAQHSPVL